MWRSPDSCWTVVASSMCVLQAGRVVKRCWSFCRSVGTTWSLARTLHLRVRNEDRAIKSIVVWWCGVTRFVGLCYATFCATSSALSHTLSRPPPPPPLSLCLRSVVSAVVTDTPSNQHSKGANAHKYINIYLHLFIYTTAIDQSARVSARLHNYSVPNTTRFEPEPAVNRPLGHPPTRLVKHEL